MYSLVDDMDFVRELCSSVHAARKAVGIPTSQPLQSLTLYKGQGLYGFTLSLYENIIADECNVKEVVWELIFDDDYRYHDISADYKLDFKKAGKLFGRDVQTIGKLVKEGKVDLLDTHAQIGEFEVPLELVSYNRSVDNTRNQQSMGLYVDLVGEESFFVLDIRINQWLKDEYFAGILTKHINKERKMRNYQITDIIDVTLRVPDDYDSISDELWDEVAKNAKCSNIFTELDKGELVITRMERSR